jgi:hypothetical protein
MSSNAISLAGLIVAVIAIVSSTVLTFLTLRLLRVANQMPVIGNLLAPHRDPSFVSHEDYLVEHIREYDPALGYGGLPEPIRSYWTEVGQQYHMVSYVANSNISDGNELLKQVRHGAIRVWDAILPHVLGERELRGGQSAFWNSFEEFVVKARHIDITGGPRERRRTGIEPA